MQVRYQAALRPDGVSNCWKRPRLYRKHLNVERFFCKFLAAQNGEYVFEFGDHLAQEELVLGVVFFGLIA